MFAYFTTQSFGMRITCSGRSILKVSVTFAPVLVPPWAKLPHYFPKPVSHTSLSSGYFDNLLYDVMSSPVLGCIAGAQKCWMFSWEWVSLIVFVMESWLSFVRGNILFIPTAASENAINASWMIIIGIQNDGLGVPCSTCSHWNIGFSTTETCFGIVLALFLSALRSSFNFFADSLFFCLVFLSFLEYTFLSFFWPPSESAIGGKHPFPPSGCTIGVGIILGVLFRVTCACILGVARMLA